MYSANYGGYGNAGPNFNNGAPQQGGQQQQMMYNQQPQQPQQQQQQQQPQQQQQQQQQPQQQQGQPQQQFGGMGPQGGYPQGANPQMMASMMQNPGMQQMAGNGQMAGFQQQFPGNPYGQMPSSAMQQNFPQGQYMMPGGMQGFQMNQGGMPQQAQQQMMQRMQAQQQAQAQAQAQAHAQAQAQAQAQANAGMTPAQTPQRPPSSAQGTPGPVPSQQGQFPTPQPPSQVPTPGHQQQQKPPPQQQPQQQQAPQQQPQSAGTATPQTPTFGANQGIPNGASSAVPLSPGTAAMESQRFSLLLDINSELLYESIQIQTSQQEIKKQRAKEASTGEKSQTDPAAQKAEDTMLQQDYLGCMNRLKANLTYMAALADRKPDVKVPQSPAYLTSPNLNLTLKLRTPAESPDADPADRESRAQAIKELYSRLQAAFPGVDPKKEPPQRPQGPGGQKPGNPVPGQQQPNSMQPTSTGAQQSSTHVP